MSARMLYYRSFEFRRSLAFSSPKLIQSADFCCCIVRIYRRNLRFSDTFLEVNLFLSKLVLCSLFPKNCTRLLQEIR